MLCRTTSIYKYINLQVLKIITYNQSGTNVYSSKRNHDNQISMKFNHLILYRVHSNRYSEDNTILVHIMEVRNENSNIWNKNMNHRHNGAILIGSFIQSPFPLLISQYMRCGISMIKSQIEISHNIVSISPSNCAFLDPTTRYGK